MQHRKLLGLLFLFPLLSISPQTSYAGDTTPLGPASCSKDSTGAGYCYGSLRTFRSSPDPTAWAYFYLSHQNSAGFGAFFGGTHYLCSFPSTAASAAFVTTASQPNTYFYVFFDRNGACTNGFAYAESQISN